MSKTSGHPALLPLRTALFLGRFGTVISRALQVNIDSNDEDYKQTNIEKETLIYRAQIGQQAYDIVLNEIQESDTTHVSLRAVRLLAQYFSFSNAADREKQEAVIQQLDNLLSDALLATDSTLNVVAATIYLQEKKPTEALRYVFTPATLEMYVFFLFFIILKRRSNIFVVNFFFCLFLVLFFTGARSR